jgi:hypothetical protein
MNRCINSPRKVLIFGTVLGLFFLAMAIWWFTAGRVSLVHYPNATLERGEECCNWELSASKNWGMITISRRFLVSESNADVVNEWYKERGWFRFGERLQYPYIQVARLRFESAKEFNLGEPDESNLLIVQTILYRYSFVSEFEP